MNYKVKVLAIYPTGSFTFFVNCKSTDLTVYFNHGDLTFLEFSQFVSPRTASRYKSCFDNGFIHCVILKAVRV